MCFFFNARMSTGRERNEMSGDGVRMFVASGCDAST